MTDLCVLCNWLVERPVLHRGLKMHPECRLRFLRFNKRPDIMRIRDEIWQELKELPKRLDEEDARAEKIRRELEDLRP